MEFFGIIILSVLCLLSCCDLENELKGKMHGKVHITRHNLLNIKAMVKPVTPKNYVSVKVWIDTTHDGKFSKDIAHSL